MVMNNLWKAITSVGLFVFGGLCVKSNPEMAYSVVILGLVVIWLLTD